MAKIKNIPMNYEHNKLGYGQKNPGLFRKELLDNNIFTTFDAIKFGFRTATSRKEKYKKGDIIKFYKYGRSEYLLCEVITDSYKTSDISKEKWSELEGWDVSYFDLNPDVIKKYQFQFKLIK